MAKLVLSMFTSLDGYIEGPGGEFMPPAWSDDLERHWSGYALDRAGHLLYGRTNFLFNKAFWSAAETDPDSPAAGIAYAGTMNRLPKTVFSRTLTGDPGWNATLVEGRHRGRRRKTQSARWPATSIFLAARGLPTALSRSTSLTSIRLMVTPELFGDGKRLFETGRPRMALTMSSSMPLDTGAVILHYRRNRDA